MQNSPIDSILSLPDKLEFVEESAQYPSPAGEGWHGEAVTG